VIQRKVVEKAFNAATAEAAAQASSSTGQAANPTVQKPNIRHYAHWGILEDILGHAKTQFPLLTLSMEMLVDQLYQRFKQTSEEDLYRLLQALLVDGLQVCSPALSNLYEC